MGEVEEVAVVLRRIRYLSQELEERLRHEDDNPGTKTGALAVREARGLIHDLWPAVGTVQGYVISLGEPDRLLLKEMGLDDAKDEGVVGASDD